MEDSRKTPNSRRGRRRATMLPMTTSPERPRPTPPGLASGLLGLLLVAAAPLDADSNWPSWRGPLGTGFAPDADPPLVWSERENVAWKLALPGKGHSSPIVWGERLFVTTAVPHGEAVEPKPETAPGAHDNILVTHHHRFLVIAVNVRSGKVDWMRAVRTELPHEGGHYSGSYASASPVTDGELVFASFGSRGVFCLDLDGELVWKTDLGDMQTKHGHGEGSSPVLHGDTLAVNWDHEGQSFLVALDKRTGRQRWKVKRDEVTSWATPIVVEHEGTPQLIVSGTRRVRAYDLADGRVIWECGGMSNNVVASPVAGLGMVFVASSYEIQAMLAIRLAGARGDVTGTDQVVWSRTRRTPYVPSPLLGGDALYFLRHYQGILSRVDARTGDDTHRPIRLPGIRNIYASPVGAGDRVYVTDLEGVTAVVRFGSPTEILGLNRLDDRISASAAVVGRRIYLRGERYLYCVEETDETERSSDRDARK